MSGDNISQLQRELHEVEGGLDLLSTLREEFAEWVEEAQDDSKREALENVLGHIEVMQTEYKTRLEGLRKKASS